MRNLIQKIKLYFRKKQFKKLASSGVAEAMMNIIEAQYNAQEKLKTKFSREIS